MNPKVLIYWIVVGLPLGWGLYKSVERSLPLFNPPAPPAAVVPANPPPAPPK